MRTYTLKSHQREILNDVRSLPLKNLHYLVIQQSKFHPNLTLNELKKHIRRGVTSYVKELSGYKYKVGLENELVSYYCFFETSKEFFLSQHLNTNIKEQIEIDLHFHLFLSGNSNMVHCAQLIQYIIRELLSQKNKQRSLRLIDFKALNQLDDDFILYHTKQMMYRPSPQMIIHNLK